MNKIYTRYVTPTQNLNLKMKVQYNHELRQDLKIIELSRDSDSWKIMLNKILQDEADKNYSKLVMEIKNEK